jgi:hypothetical protein
VKTKGVVFSLEAMLAASLLLSSFLFLQFLILENVSPYKRFERLNLFAKDSLEVMSKMKVGSLIDEIDILKEQYENGKITDNETSIIEVIGGFWASGDTDTAKEIARQVLERTMPKGVNYKLLADGTEIFSSSGTIFKATEVSQSSKYLSGFQAGKVIKGFTARAFLQKIESQMFSSYLYFGGFVGQGNISLVMRDLPSDAEVKSVYVEANLGDDFDFYINGVFCERIERSVSPLEVKKITITDGCISSIKAGEENLFQFNSTGTEISKSYLSGGFVRVDYLVSAVSLPTENVIRYYFPGIEGQINLYDSFFIPGDLTSMEIHLVLRNDFKTYLKIGDKVVMEAEGSENLQTINLDNTRLSSILDYKSISKNNIPVRLSFEIPEIKGTADVVLITDVSGSMNWRVNDSVGGNDRKCNDPLLYDNTTKRISLAKCLDKDFVDTILGIPGNRIALVAYDGTGNCIRSNTSLTNDSNLLKNTIESYTASGGTCIACSINKAYEILKQQSGEDRQKFIVVMTDGLANTYPSTENGYQTCEVDSLYRPPGCYEGVGDRSAMDTVKAACRANADLDATIHSIGFGPITTCKFSSDMLKNVSDCGNGIYAASSNPLELKKIYETIAQEILKKNYERQKVILTKDVKNMTLSPESYIEFTFIPLPAKPPIYGGITINLESNISSCTSTVFIPSKYRVDRFRVTSYSGDYWTDLVRLNNGIKWFNIFNLSDFGDDYTTLGDPFNVEIPPELINEGNNQINIRTATSLSNPNPECSRDNKAIYTVTFSTITDYSPIMSKSYVNGTRVYYNKGDYDCNPEGYVEINPESKPILDVEDLDMDNAIHNATAELLNMLNFFDCPGKAGSSTDPIDLEITPELKIESSEIKNVPSLWGPSKFTLMVWT